MRVIIKTIRHSKKILLSGAVTALLGIGLVAAPAVSALTIAGPGDCDANAIVNCGVHSTAAVMNAYQSSAYVQKVYAFFGISGADIGNLQATNMAGRVTSDGRVFVDGQSQAVATGAITGGRQNIAGSQQVTSGGVTFFVRPPSVSFQQASLPAFVSMQNGRFQFAIIASCGNAVKATPVTPPGKAGLTPNQPVSKPQVKPAPKPAPAPAPTQTQTQSQSQQVNVINANVTVNKVNNTQSPGTSAATTTTQPAPQTQTTASPASQPASLVNTGSGGVVAVFLTSSVAGAFAFRRFLTHKLNNA